MVKRETIDATIKDVNLFILEKENEEIKGIVK